MRKFNPIKIITATSLAVPFVVLVSCNKTTNNSIAILYTNDVHTTLQESSSNMSYSNVKGYKNHLQQQGYSTLLVDSGDFSAGGIYGTIRQGEYMTHLMNVAEYDLCTCGNHEFDFGMTRFNEIREELNCPMISSNFYHMENNVPTTRVLDDTKTFNINGKKIGFVGASTPATITSSNPSSFQDDHGNYIYTFCGFGQPSEFYSVMQQSIDKLHDEKCDVVIALTHLGEGEVENPYEVTNVIANTKGVDIFLDGHSHTVDLCTKVKNKENKDVLLTQTGTGLKHFGQLIIDQNNNLSISMINTTKFHDEKVDSAIKEIVDKTEPFLKTIIGTIDFKLRIRDDLGKRLVRKEETNLGDMVADAYYYTVNDSEVAFAFSNSGGIRTDINSGDVTVGDIMKVAPFGNTLCKAKITGQKILDALEFAVSKQKGTDGVEFGGFLQVSSQLQFTADLTIDTPVVTDAKGFKEITSGATRRIKADTVKIKGTPIDPTAYYKVVCTTYTMRDFGDGYNMFKEGVEMLSCPPIMDFNAIMGYFEDCHNKPEFKTAYDYAAGSGSRITLIKE